MNAAGIVSIGLGLSYRSGEGGPLLEHLLGVVDVEVDDAHLVAALLGRDQRVYLLQQLVVLFPVAIIRSGNIMSVSYFIILLKYMIVPVG